MTKGQLSRKASRRQEEVETTLALLGRINILLEMDTLRVQQAIQRAGLGNLLGPVVDNNEAIRRDVRRVQKHLRQIWDEGQDSRWSDASSMPDLKRSEFD